MIKIEQNNMSQIEITHLRHCKPYVLKLIRFYEDFFSRFANNNHVQFNGKILSKYYDIDARTIKVLIKPFFQNQAHIDNPNSVKITEIEETLNSNNNIIINNTIDYKEFYSFIEELKKELDIILIGKPDELNKIINKSIYSLSDGKGHVFSKIFNYEMFTGDGYELIIGNSSENWGSYELTKSLRVNVCPYCNRNWINTVGFQNGKVTNPQLDHFFSQKDFPILRISLYNLIPSCETCNSRLKNKISFKFDTHLHPFMDGYEKYAKFRSIALDYESGVGKANDFHILLKLSDLISDNRKIRIEKNHEIFKINEIYKHHGDIVSEIYLKKQLYSENYLAMLMGSIKFPREININQLYRIAFANYLDEKDFQKRPFAKLIRDIAEQLELIEIK